jgi:hypothetical protein
MKNNIRLTTIVFLLSLLYFGCGDDKSFTGSGEFNTLVKGRVTEGDGFQKNSGSTEGVIVTAASIQSDGTLETVSEAGVETDENGEFELAINTDGNSNILILATKGSQQWGAYMSSRIESGQINYCSPLNIETTGEAEVFSEVLKDKKTDVVEYHDVAYYIDSEIAADIELDKNKKKELKDAIYTEAEARISALTNSHYGYTEFDYKEASGLEADAQKEFETTLYLNSDNIAISEAAWEGYFESVISGYTTTSISLSHLAQAREISGRAMILLNANLDSTSAFRLAKRNAYFKVKLISEAIINECEKAGAKEEDINEIKETNNQLRVSVKTAATIEDIDKAFTDYRVTIKAKLKTFFKTLAVSLTSVEAAIESTVKSATSIQNCVSAYAVFFKGIDAVISNNLNIPDNLKMEAFGQIYAMIYMHN